MKDLHLESQKRLQHILQAILIIEEYVKDSDAIHFIENLLLHDAVLFQFTIIGEAINHVEGEKLERYAYPWYKVRSFRNLIAHEYFNIKLSAVWIIIEGELPQLKATIESVLANEFKTL
jgi:uncharacterized protein with HEPN domain